MKVVINACFGGFSLSKLAVGKLRELGEELEYPGRDIARDSDLLVRVVGELGSAADGAVARLAVVEIPDGIEWAIEEYDGNEWVAEKHRTWYAE